jgi:thiol-disulfide isomerase/thioredoxin
MHRHVFLICSILLLAACGSDDSSTEPAAVEPQVDTPEAAVEANPTDGINWFDGSVDEAFAEAKESGKPVFLYWGAVWCPPCHAISATVFKSPEFVQRSELFVPVYLDGDEEDAQAYGEKFGVLGYPTMIVFDSDGNELTRIPGGIDLQAYANILDVTLSNGSSVSNLLATVMTGTADLSAVDCTLLAYYSWGQDPAILADVDSAEAFDRMYAACPSELAAERSILYLSWLNAALDATDAGGNSAPLSEQQREEALRHIADVLASADLIKANIFTVLFSGPKFVAALTAPGSAERDHVAASFDSAFDTVANDESVYKRERIYTLAGKMRFERMDNEEAEISDALKQEIREMVVWADESTPSVYERQPIINALGNVLNEAGMDDVAKPLLIAELERSNQPYYYMPSLADIEQRAGNNEKALEWLKAAYDQTKGPATRFQWGYYYLAGLVEMAPDNVDLIHATTVGLIAELQQSNSFHQRPKSQLGRLENYLREWGETDGNGAALDAIRQSVLEVCTRVVEAPSREVCESFLAAV